MVVVVDEGEPAGVFGLGGADQAPDGGGGQVVDVLAGVGGDRVAGEDGQPGGGEPVVGQPALQQPQHRGGGGGESGRHVLLGAVGCLVHRQHHRWRAAGVAQADLQGGQVGVAVGGDALPGQGG